MTVMRATETLKKLLGPTQDFEVASPAVTIRYARPDDALALLDLADLDSSTAPPASCSSRRWGAGSGPPTRSTTATPSPTRSARPASCRSCWPSARASSPAPRARPAAASAPSRRRRTARPATPSQWGGRRQAGGCVSARRPDVRHAVSDPHRLRALEAAELLDTPAEAAFDRLTNLATRILGVPVALVSLVTPDRQFFKSQCGLPVAVRGAARDPALALVLPVRRRGRRRADRRGRPRGRAARLEPRDPRPRRDRLRGLPDPDARGRRARLVLRDRRPAARVVARRPRDPLRAGRRRDRRGRAARGGRGGRRRRPAPAARARAGAGRAARRDRLGGVPPRRAALPARRRLLPLRGAAATARSRC